MLGEQWSSEERSAATLAELGGSGGSASEMRRRFVARLDVPSEGFELVFQWTAEQIPLTRQFIDARPILEAAQRSELAWP
jgi:hypothetical protein